MSEPSRYPALEGFIEQATQTDIEALFEPLKESLASLKGARAETGKKVSVAIDKTTELLQYLLQVREKIESQRPKSKSGKR